MFIINKKISVIIAVYNGNSKHYDICRTIESVISQSYKNWEAIIINDGSTDDTEKVIKKYFKDKRIKYFYQQNSGVYSAMNLGIKKSKGDILYFLNSDDYLFSKTVFEEVVNEFDDGSDILCCSIAVERKKGLRKIFTPFSKLNLKLGRIMNHQGTFFKKKCFKNKLYSLKKDHAGDYDFFCYCAEKGFKAKNVPKLVIANYSLEGRSSKGYEDLCKKIIIDRYGRIFLIFGKIFFLFRRIISIIEKILIELGLIKDKNIIYKK